MNSEKRRDPFWSKKLILRVAGGETFEPCFWEALRLFETGEYESVTFTHNARKVTFEKGSIQD